ncbi:transcription initiation factor TFIID subunit 12-like [Corticium candelabrum]|uniref:transcription initiation factor TFIID subunit 12-like n=1 Tax=Corticium candelabrum TaxID=121492 RepID=UPI002E272961|nr:transcription initiation factor TFIID subunit 12-like [Corticium candelabrum]
MADQSTVAQTTQGLLVGSSSVPGGVPVAVAMPSLGQSVGTAVTIPAAAVNTSGLLSSTTAGMQLMVTAPVAGALTKSGTQLKPILPNQTMIPPQIAARGMPGHPLIAPAPTTQATVDPSMLAGGGTGTGRLPPSTAKPATTSTAASNPLPAVQQSTVQRSTQQQPRNAQKQGVTRKRLQDLIKEIDPLEQLDEDVEEVIMQMADDFIDTVVSQSCMLARHRNSNTLEVKDVQLHLENCWNMWIPGFGSDDVRPYQKSATTEAHRQRLALIRKSVKK